MLSIELRAAWRRLLRRPRFTAALVLTYALGLAVAGTVFCGADAMLFRPLPFAGEERLVALHESQPRLGKTWNSIAPPTFLDWRERSRQFSALAAFERTRFDLGGTGEPERVPGARVSANFFDVLGARVGLGRSFARGEDAAGLERLVVISDRLWRRRLGGDPRAVGRSLLVNGVSHRIVGVMPARFEYPEWAEIWVPLVLDRGAARDARMLDAVARLRDSSTVARAQREMDQVSAGIANAFPSTNAEWGAFVRPIREELIPRAAQAGIYAELGAVALLLFLVCANVANLLLADRAARLGEMAVRTALGAGRLARLRPLVLENLFVAIPGGILGLTAAAWGIDLMVKAVPFQIPRWIVFELNGNTALAMALLTTLVGIATAVLPALHASAADVTSLQRGESGNAAVRPRTRLRSGLLVFQVAVTLVLLVAALLLARNAANASARAPGFAVDGVLTARLSLDAGADENEKRLLVRRILDAARDTVRLGSIAIATALPVSREGVATTAFEPEDSDNLGRVAVTAARIGASEGYVGALGLRVERGRPITESESARGARVALVSRSLADRLWPGRDPIDRRLRPRGGGDWLRVVGVVQSIAPPAQMAGVDAWPDAQLYAPLAPALPHADEVVLVVRSTAPGPGPAALRSAIHRVAPILPVFDVQPMKEVLRQAIWLPLFWSQFFGVFAALALLIALVGVYTFTAYSVSLRKREFGIRMALGARPAELPWLALREMAPLALISVLLGLAAALGLSRALSLILTTVSATDSRIYLGAMLLLLATVCAAAHFAARPACRADPATLLASQ